MRLSEKNILTHKTKIVSSIDDSQKSFLLTQIINYLSNFLFKYFSLAMKENKQTFNT